MDPGNGRRQLDHPSPILRIVHIELECGHNFEIFLGLRIQEDSDYQMKSLALQGDYAR